MRSSNTNDDPLFALIKSISLVEKAYFRKFVNLHIKGDTNNYVQLFDVMEAMESYDKSAIQKGLGAKNLPNQLHRVKNYLYHQILKSLRAFHADLTIDGQLKNTLRDVEILYSKAMYAECDEKLNTAKLLAYKYEKLTRIIELLEWEIKLIPKDIGFEDQGTILRELFEERRVVLEKKLNLYQYELWFNKIYTLCKSNNKIRDPKQLEPWDKIMRLDIFKDENMALSFYAKVLFNFCWGIFYYCSGQWENVKKYVARREELLESRPDLLHDAPHQYINVLGNMLTVQVNLSTGLINSFDVHERAFHDIMNKLKKFSRSWNSIVGSKEIEQRVFANSTVHELGFYISRGEFKKAVRVARKTEKQMSNSSNKIGLSSELAFFYYSAYAHFGNGESRKALQYINQLLNNNYFAIRVDLQCFARILNLLIHYELDNIFVLENAVLHARRFIKNKGLLFKYEKNILSFFRKASLLKFDDKKSETKGLLELREKLLRAKESEYSENFDEYHHFMWWIESKLRQQPLSKIIKEGLRKSNAIP
ncbi:MAG TPA: hypothetical protein EYN89_06915 [Flavobacteriales bacterium]|nr:hypothetical protein [Flavobacteriales bacterium]